MIIRDSPSAPGLFANGFGGHLSRELLAFGKAYRRILVVFQNHNILIYVHPCTGPCAAIRHSLSLGVCIADLHGGTAFHKSVFSVLTKRKWVRISKFGPSPLRRDGLAMPQIRMQGILFGMAVMPHLVPDSLLTKLALR